ncbi:MAG TPA: BlaI/MecI/CopY family transcriptional regulator [bacterium]|nr:BlaI/MecI/CopY family transcriptional regulator [bacterium]HPN43148.1 BlaI/MecI/CopY family transcriptional regulator [bacterium]
MEKQIKPTEAELEILHILWQTGPASVKFVNDTLQAKKPVGYTTTLKIMQIMTQKGILKREKTGKSHLYIPVLQEHETQNALINKLLETAFGGSALNLVMQALGNRKTSNEEIEQIKEFLDHLQGEQK